MNRVVIKFGSISVSDSQGGLNPRKMSVLVDEVEKLLRLGFKPLLVSSGAINSGKIYLNKPVDKKDSMSFQQAAAAIGQPLLMEAYTKLFAAKNLRVAQILVTHDDFKNRKRFLNIRNTLNLLLNQGVIPIINENDTVSFEEITVGDNDQLSVMLAEACEAQKLLLLTEADGLYDKNPQEPGASQLKIILPQDDLSMIKLGAKTSVGRGGMQAKLKAIRKLTDLGVDVHLGSFAKEKPLQRLLQGEGTLFRAQKMEFSSRKSWLLSIVKNDCYVTIDEGALKALTEKKTSLLPVGIKQASGQFKRGDVIQVKHKRKTIAVGICEFDAKEIEKFKGKKSDEILNLDPLSPSLEAIHKDNLYLL